MTKIGKFLVVLNLVIAVTMLVWSFLVFTTQRLAPGVVPAGPPRAGGELPNRAQNDVFALQARTDQLAKELAESEAKYKASLANLRRLELAYYANPAWYSQELQKLDTADDAIDLQAPRTTQGKVDFDATAGSPNYGRPVMADVLVQTQKMKSAKYYTPRLRDEHEQAITKSQQLVTLSKKSEALTYELSGDDQATPKVKGLRLRIEEEIFKLRQLVGEDKDLEEMRTKLIIDDVILKRRVAELEDRLVELEKAEKASARKP